MNYKKLIESHKLFYQIERRAFNYDGYLKCKDWACWNTPDLSINEIKFLFNFIKSWDRFFQGDIDLFREIYKEVFPTLQKLKSERIEYVNLTKELTTEIRNIFDKVANCTIINRYESTDASKILHTILPEFFVMWDDRIKEKTVNGGGNGAVYAIRFLPKIQSDLREAIGTCMRERDVSREEAIKYICDSCDGKTLAKLVDEYNYMKYTKNYSSL